MQSCTKNITKEKFDKTIFIDQKGKKIFRKSRHKNKK